MSKTKSPKVFISYAWEDDIKKWVRSLATRLRTDGIETIFDEWATVPGDQLPEFMEKSIRESAFVLVISTPKYKYKSDNRSGGVGYEGDIITSELITTRNQRKFIPILRKGVWSEAAPSWLLGKVYINLSDDPYNENNYQDLLKTLHGNRELPPPVGKMPFRKKSPQKPPIKKNFTKMSFSIGARLALISALLVITVFYILWSTSPFFTEQPVTPFLETPATQLTGTRTPNITLTASLVPSKTPISTKTSIPIPYQIEIVDGNGINMRLIPAGSFIMGSTSEDASNECKKYFSDNCEPTIFKNEEPPHTVFLDNYYIDKYEVINSQYRKCVDAGVCKPPDRNGSNTRENYYNDQKYDNYPVVFIDWDMANTYCQWRGVHLPTEAQWEKAARGTDGLTYPWGEGLSCSVVNFYTSNKNCVIDDTVAVGSYEKGKSVFGVYDLTGNVTEWVQDWYQENYYATLGNNAINPVGPNSGQYRIIRGGSYANVKLTGRSAMRFFVDPTNSGFDSGFRCALNP